MVAKLRYEHEFCFISIKLKYPSDQPVMIFF